LQRQGAAESGHPQAAKASSDRPGASAADSALPCPRPRPIDHITRWCIPHTSMKTAKLPCVTKDAPSSSRSHPSMRSTSNIQGQQISPDPGAGFGRKHSRLPSPLGSKRSVVD
jgi:hypothetical protein